MAIHWNLATSTSRNQHHSLTYTTTTNIMYNQNNVDYTIDTFAFMDKMGVEYDTAALYTAISWVEDDNEYTY